MKKIVICAGFALSMLLGDAIIETKGNPIYKIDTELSTQKEIASGSVIEFSDGKGTIILRDKETKRALYKLRKKGDDYEVPKVANKSTNTNLKINLKEVNAATNLNDTKK